MKIPSSRVSTFAVAGGLAAAIAAGVVYAKDSGVINGCYKTENGQLRVVGDDGKCLPSETAISWNQVGPMGLQGQQGLQGTPGLTGARGPSDAYDAFRLPGFDIPVTSTSQATPTFVLTSLLTAGTSP